MTPRAATPETPPTYVARTPVDLIAIVPFVLGFHPDDSVVLLTFGSPHGSFHARVDLPHTSAERSEVVTSLCTAVGDNRARTAVVLVFSRDHRAATRISADLVPALLGIGVEVIDTIRTDGSRWWSVQPGGHPGPAGPGHAYDLSTHPFTAARVLDGQAAFADRAELAASVRPDRTDAALIDRVDVTRAAGAVADELRAGPGGDQERRRSARWLLAQVRPAPAAVAGTHRDRDGDNARPQTRPSAEIAARIGVLVQVPEMRRAVTSTFDRPGAPAQVRWWRDLLVRMPDELVPGVAAVLALAAWLAGEGALAWCAVDRCEECAPDDDDGSRAGRDLADRVATLLREARPPSTWRASGRAPLVSP